MASVLTVRVPEALEAMVVRRSRAEGGSLSEGVRRALVAYVDASAPASVDSRLGDLERRLARLEGMAGL